MPIAVETTIVNGWVISPQPPDSHAPYTAHLITLTKQRLRFWFPNKRSAISFASLNPAVGQILLD